MTLFLHLFWYQGWEHAPAHAIRNARLHARLNPEWRIMLWDRHSAERLLFSRYRWLVPRYRQIRTVIVRCDFLRLLIIHAMGGAYLDCDLRPVDSLPGDVSRPRFGRESVSLPGRYGVANGVLIAPRKHPIWMDFIDYCHGFSPSDEGSVVGVLEYYGPWRLTPFLEGRDGIAYDTPGVWFSPTIREESVTLHPDQSSWKPGIMTEGPALPQPRPPLPSGFDSTTG